MLPDDGSGQDQQGIQDAEIFTEHLSQQLAQLDEANIHTLMDSETQIFTLMQRIDETMFEIQVYVCVNRVDHGYTCGCIE